MGSRTSGRQWQNWRNGFRHSTIRRFVPSPNRFPSAANVAGFKPLVDYVHSKGLKFGIHIMRGIPREAVDRNLPIKGTKFRAADVADKVNVCKWDGMEETYGADMSKPARRLIMTPLPSSMPLGG